MIKILPHTRKDVSQRVKWLNNYEAAVYAIDNPKNNTNEEIQNKWFDDYEERLKSGEKLFFTIYSDDKPIGFMGLSNIDKTKQSAKIFIMIGENEYRGRGIGRESINYLIDHAFKDLKLKSLYLDVKKLNEIAINLYSRVGFQKTGEDGDFVLMTLSANNNI